MRERNAFLIAKEYVQPGEAAQVRKNALTAMALLDDPDSRKVLTDVALGDADPGVRERAEAEIASLPPASAKEALGPVLEDLKAPGRQQNAYALLGRLRNRGMAFEFPSLPAAVRVRLAKSLRDYLYPKRDLRFRFRSVKGASAGTFLAWMATMVLCAGPLDIHMDLWSTVGYLFVGWILAACIAIPATCYTSPVRLYADTKGGALLDMLVAALVSLAAAAVCVLIAVSTDEKKVPGVPRQSLLLLLAPLTAAAVRAGTLSAFGIAGTARPNRLMQIAVGGSCGVAVFDLVLMVSGEAGDPFLAGAWMVTILMSYGLAGAFAWIDSRSAALPVSPRYAQVAGLGLTLIAVSFALIPAVPLPSAPVTLDSPALALSARDIPLRQVPGSVIFKNSQAYQITHALDDYKNYDSDAVQAAGQDQKLVVKHRDKDTSIFEALPQVAKAMSWPQVKARMMRIPPDRGPVLVNVHVTVKPRVEGR
jgi:hypothetical protein